jgi:hypothetical protein
MTSFTVLVTRSVARAGTVIPALARQTSICGASLLAAATAVTKTFCAVRILVTIGPQVDIGDAGSFVAMEAVVARAVVITRCRAGRLKLIHLAGTESREVIPARVGLKVRSACRIVLHQRGSAHEVGARGVDTETLARRDFAAGDCLGVFPGAVTRHLAAIIVAAAEATAAMTGNAIAALVAAFSVGEVLHANVVTVSIQVAFFVVSTLGCTNLADTVLAGINPLEESAIISAVRCRPEVVPSTKPMVAGNA